MRSQAKLRSSPFMKQTGLNNGDNRKREAFWHYVLPLAILMVLVLMLILTHLAAPSPTIPMEYTGSLFISDAGQSHGGFEYTATYDAMLRIVGTIGVLTLTLNAGLGDALTQHTFSVSSFQSDAAMHVMSFYINNFRISMLNVSEDKIWNGTYSNYYVASWGGYAPADELIGTISPQAFPGLPNFYYVELRLR